MILVTGATGFIGSEVVKQLSDEGLEFKCLVRTPGTENRIKSSSAKIHYGDLLNPKSLPYVFSGVDTVINVAGTLPFGDNAEGYRRKNVGSVVNLVEAGEDAGVRKIVHISAVGGSQDHSNVFLKSKYLSENVVTRGTAESTVLRLPHVFGPRDSFTNYCASLMKIFPFKLMYGDPESILQPIHVSDVAQCIVRSAVNDDMSGKVVDLVGPESISYADLFTIIRNRFVGTVIPYSPVIEIPDWVSKIFSSLWSDISPLSFSFGQYLRSDMTSSDDAVEKLFGFEPRLLFNNIQHVQSIKYSLAFKVLFGDKNQW